MGKLLFVVTMGEAAISEKKMFFRIFAGGIGTEKSNFPIWAIIGVGA